MKRILVGAHQSPTCYTLSPHTVAKNSLGAAAKQMHKKVFQHQPFGERQGSLRKSARTCPNNRSVVNSPFGNPVDFFGVDGSAGVQPINGICYLGLPEKPCCLGPTVVVSRFGITVSESLFQLAHRIWVRILLLSLYGLCDQHTQTDRQKKALEWVKLLPS